MPPASPELQKLLDALGPLDELNFHQLIAAAHAVGYTGHVVLHFFNGRPKQVDMGPPVKLSIAAGLDRDRLPPTR